MYIDRIYIYILIYARVPRAARPYYGLSVLWCRCIAFRIKRNLIIICRAYDVGALKKNRGCAAKISLFVGALMSVHRLSTKTKYSRLCFVYSGLIWATPTMAPWRPSHRCLGAGARAAGRLFVALGRLRPIAALSFGACSAFGLGSNRENGHHHDHNHDHHHMNILQFFEIVNRL